MKEIFVVDWDKILLIALFAFLLLHYTTLVPPNYDSLFLFILSSIATLPVLWNTLQSLRKRQTSVFLLASIALVASLIAREFSSAAFLGLMLTSARIFATYTEGKAKAAIQSLLKLRPQNVKVKQGDKIVVVGPEGVKVGDLVVIESGDRVPIDGTIIQGEANIDQSSLTGESMPIVKLKGDPVYSSTLNVSGSIVVKTEKIGKDTTLEKIISLVEGSQKEKADIRTVAEKFAMWYIAATLIGSVIIYLIFKDLLLVLALLIVVSADDIAVAVPMAFTAAIGYAARRGVIIKGGKYLEGLSKVKLVIVDKTGTVTKGKLKVHQVKAYPDFSREEVLRLAGIIESVSEHPIAKAIASYAQSQKLQAEKLSELKEIPSKGMRAVYRGKNLLVGSIAFADEERIHMSKAQVNEMIAAQNQGFNISAVAYDNKLIGFITCADALRPKIKEAVDELKDLGVKSVTMLTGDNERVAERIAGEIGVVDFHANLLPEDKLDYLRRSLNNGYKVAMVGDGVNDAAGLALADIGIAMGVIGSDAAIESADVALMRDDFSEIPEMVKLSNYTNKIAYQDFWIWGVVNAFGLFIVFARLVGPEGAAVSNFITDFFPIINSLRLFNLHLKPRQ